VCFGRAAQAAALALALLLNQACDPTAGIADSQVPPHAVPPCPPFVTPEAYAAARQSAVDIFITSRSEKANVLHAIVGAGFVIEKSGYVLTCSHVAEPDGNRTVGLHDAQTIEEGLPYRVLVRNDPMDVGIIKIEAPGRTFAPARIGRSSDLQVGDPVFVIGNPNGQRHSVATGKLTALRSNWGYQWGSGGTWHHDFLACNAPAKPGFSGGPLCNARGEVVGIFSGNMTGGTEPASFAVPIDKIMMKLPDILDVESPRGMVVGLSVVPLGPAEVRDVVTGSPAAIAGLRPGDVLIQVGDRELSIGLDYYLSLLDHKAGDQLRLRYRRGGAEKDAAVTIQQPPLRKAEQVADLKPGMRAAYYEGQWSELPEFDKLTPKRVGVVKAIDVGFRRRDDHFALKFSGYLKVPQSGRYLFSSASDDGSQLYIGDQRVVDNNGSHGPTAAKGYISLEAGLHPLMVLYFEDNGGEVLSVEYESPGIARQRIPAAALFHRPE